MKPPIACSGINARQSSLSWWGNAYEAYNSIVDQHGGHPGHRLPVSQFGVSRQSLVRPRGGVSSGNRQRRYPPRLHPADPTPHPDHSGALSPGDQRPHALAGRRVGRGLPCGRVLGGLFWFPPHQLDQLGPFALDWQLAPEFQAAPLERRRISSILASSPFYSSRLQ